jgi:hypothetical protein
MGTMLHFRTIRLQSRGKRRWGEKLRLAGAPASKPVDCVDSLSQ